MFEFELCFKLMREEPWLMLNPHWQISCFSVVETIGGSKGGRQGCAPPPWGSKFFHFHAVFGKNVKNNSNFGSWRPPPGKILDPPLETAYFSAQEFFDHMIRKSKTVLQ